MSDDDADVVLAGIEALAADGVQLEAIRNDERSPFDDGGDRTERAVTSGVVGPILFAHETARTQLEATARSSRSGRATEPPGGRGGARSGRDRSAAMSS